MPMPNVLAAIALGLLALFAILGAVRALAAGPAARGRAIGWVIIAVAAAIEVLNLVLRYHWALSVLVTIALLAGLWMLGRGPDRSVAPGR